MINLIILNKLRRLNSKYICSIFYLISLFNINLYSNLYSQPKNNAISTPTKELIFALDYQQEETFTNTLNTQASNNPTDSPGGLNAISLCLLVALEQNKIPIVASTNLIKNILDHKRLFLDFARQPIKYLTSKYGKYKRFNSHENLIEFQELCKYYYKTYKSVSTYLESSGEKTGIKASEQICDKICKLPEFSSANAPLKVQNEPNNEMGLYLMCARISLTSEKWLIKEVDNNLTLLIPQELTKNIRENATSTNITKLEKELGLKIQHLKTIFQKDILNYKTKPISTTESFIEALNNIFVQKSNYNYNEKVPVWSFYITGHGIPTINSDVLLEQLKALEKHYTNIISTGQFADCFKSKESPEQHRTHIRNCNKHHHFKRQYNDLECIKREIKKLQKQQEYLTYMHKGLIVSLAKDVFQKMLIFFNNKINTGFLFYSSCYAGGEHLFDPYSQNNASLVLNYPVISGTLAENMSLQETPQLRIPPYNKYRLTKEDVTENRLKIRTTLNYEKFFQELRDGKHKNDNNLHQIVSYLHPYTDEHGKLVFDSLRNIPSYRPAYAKSFSVLSGIPSFTIFNNENCQNKKRTSLKIETEANLLYTDYVPYSLICEKKHRQAPVFVSMLPSLASHVIEEIKAPQYTLHELLNGFLIFPEMKAPKIFWIKKITCINSTNLNSNFFSSHKNKTITLHDVIILRNICTSESLSKLSPIDQTEGQNYIFFTKYPSGRSYKISWNGTELSTENSTITPYKSKKYKRELIAFRPEILDHTFKTLHNILALPVSIIA